MKKTYTETELQHLIATLHLPATNVFDENIGHFTAKEQCYKLLEEVEELYEAFGGVKGERVDECSDVMTIAYNLARMAGFKGSPNDLYQQAADKLKKRVKSGERVYKC